jgi:hypothetical protein
MYQCSQRNDTICIETGSQHAQTFAIPLKAMTNLIRDAASFLRCSFQDRVRSYVINEVLSKVSGEIREPLVSECLN